jgi:PST family polysaccharide transporter
VTATLALMWRTRRHIRSFDDAALLSRAVVMHLVMPLLLKLEWSRLVGVLESLSHLTAVPPGPRADRIDFYIRACGGVRRGPFQDNCVARSLVRFTLLNHPDRPLDVLTGVRIDGATSNGPELGQRHVWLAAAGGQPFLEAEPVDDYVVQFRYRDRRQAAGGDSTGLPRFLVLLGASGVASASAGLASVVRTKIVAVGLGPAGLALVSQMSSAVNVLAWLSVSGASGSVRLVAEALGRGERDAAATVVRTTGVVLSAVVIVVLAGGVAAAELLATAAFGDRGATTWVLWLLVAAPAAAVTAASTAVLRGAQQIGRLAVARIVASVASVAGGWAIVVGAGMAMVVAVPLLLVVAMAIATSVAAWPLGRPWLQAGGRWFDRRVARRVASYSLATVVMGLATAATFMAIGRHYLAAGDLETAGRIAALVWLSEPLAAAFAAGHHGSTFPAYAAAAGPAAGRVLARGVRGLVLLAVPVLMVVSMAAGPLVQLAFSAAFADIVAFVPLLAVATYLRSASIVLGLALLARGRLLPLTVMHLGWTGTLAGLALVRAAPGLSGVSAFATGYFVAVLGHFVVQLALLRRVRLAPTPRDLVWIGAGILPLLSLAVLR